MRVASYHHAWACRENIGGRRIAGRFDEAADEAADEGDVAEEVAEGGGDLEEGPMRAVQVVRRVVGRVAGVFAGGHYEPAGGRRTSGRSASASSSARSGSWRRST